MKKKVLGVVVALLVIGVLAGACSSDEGAKDTNQAPETQTTEQATEAPAKEESEPDVPTEYKSALKKAQSLQ